MVAAGTVLKSLHPKLFHVTCIAHLLHHWAMKAKSYYQDVDQLIARIKVATVENKTRQAQFAAIGYGYPPQPIITRWGRWINATMYYENDLPEVKALAESFEESGLLVSQVKGSLLGLATQLLKI